jgi:hypothetical protein
VFINIEIAMYCMIISSIHYNVLTGTPPTISPGAGLTGLGCRASCVAGLRPGAGSMGAGAGLTGSGCRVLCVTGPCPPLLPHRTVPVHAALSCPTWRGL